MSERIIYVTYIQNNVTKKASLKESKYNDLLKDTSVSNVVMYSSEFLMEKNFHEHINKSDNSNVSNKKLLND